MIQWWQILLLTLYSAYQILDELTIVSSAGSPVFAGFISGIIMGDVQTGLWIGGSLQLMVLGVGTFGGASRIDATSGAVDTVVKFIDHYEWLANGLTLAGKMLPGLGFAILLHYLPVKRNLHYLALGFGLTAMLTTIYTNLQIAGGALAGVAKDFNAAPFKGLPMIGIAIIGLALATLHYKNGQQAPVAEQKTGVSESGEIEDDEI